MTNLAKLEHILMIATEYKDIVNSTKNRAINHRMLSLATGNELKETPKQPDFESIATNFLARIAASLEVPNE